ncbi:M23 family metallopeptidase [Saliniramus fredricksonii]|nr:M23 family metallopeptidase [Saliniramus fredricksonii]
MNMHSGNMARLRGNATIRRGIRARADDGEGPVGHEPPLDPTGATRFEEGRRGINLRWLAGAVMTAMTGAALLGSAIYIALEGRSTPILTPQFALAALMPSAGEPAETAVKDDKLVRTDYTVAARNTYRTPVTTQVGDREVVSIRGFTRIATNLSLTAGQHATDIPRFDPMSLMGDDSESVSRVADVGPRIEEAEVSFMRRTLDHDAFTDSAPALSDNEAAAQVMEELSLMRESRRRPIAPMGAQTFLSRSLGAVQPGFGDLAGLSQPTTEPFDAIEVRIIPENVSTVAKRRSRAGEGRPGEISIDVLPGEPFVAQLAAQGVARDRIEEAIGMIGGEDAVAAMQPGLAARALVAPAERPNAARDLRRLVLYGESGVNAIIAADDRGRFAEVHVTEADFQIADAGNDDRSGRASGARLHDSLYETAFKHDLSPELVETLIQIFAYDLDFQRRVSIGDSIDLFMTEGEDLSEPELLSAALTIGGETRRVYRFTDPEDGTIEFFDPEGRSLRKFLMRKPVAEGRLTSGFGMRRHPVLGYARMHTGIDYGARTGTPIFAAGNGRVIKAGWSGGYGRRVEIEHANGYVTTYSHMSRIAGGIEVGTEVTQGQVIGALGSTGLSTGPHLHYEVLVNDDFVDPLKIRVPRSRELDGRDLALFNQQRDEINELIERAGGPTRFAQGSGR